ncbi:MAG: hypothetical protein AVDCRST_MAG59-2171, partial [uncultured Thermomicrobiales bacterium]
PRMAAASPWTAASSMAAVISTVVVTMLGLLADALIVLHHNAISARVFLQSGTRPVDGGKGRAHGQGG